METNETQVHRPLPKHVEALFAKAQESIRTQNYEYAIEMLLNALDFVPDNLPIRQALRRAEIEWAHARPLNMTAQALAWLKSLPSLAEMGVARLRKDNARSLDRCERVLRLFPQHPALLAWLAADLDQCHYDDALIDTLELLIRVDRANWAAYKRLAELYDSRGRIQDGMRCYQTVLKANPHDADADRGYKNLIAKKTLEVGKWDNSDTFRDKIRDSDEARILEKVEQVTAMGGEAGSEVIDYHISKLTSSPEDLNTIRKLADLYLKGDQFDDAEAMYVKGAELQPLDPYFNRMVVHVRTRRITHEIDTLKNSLKTAPDEATARRIHELEVRRLSMELEEFRRMVALYPTDTNFKYKLGALLQESGQIEEAIGMFQKCVNTPDLAFEAHMRLAECFALKNMLDLALEFYTKASEKLAKFDEADERRKDLHYQIGQIYERLGQKDKALELYKQIYGVDIDYRDVREKLNRLYSDPSKS